MARLNDRDPAPEAAGATADPERPTARPVVAAPLAVAEAAIRAVDRPDNEPAVTGCVAAIALPARRVEMAPIALDAAALAWAESATRAPAITTEVPAVLREEAAPRGPAQTAVAALRDSEVDRVSVMDIRDVEAATVCV